MDILLTLVMFAVGIAALILICKLLAWPLKILWKLVINAVIGAVALLLINFVGGIFGLSIPITALSALVVGVLGVPGVIILIILQIL